MFGLAGFAVSLTIGEEVLTLMYKEESKVFFDTILNEPENMLIALENSGDLSSNASSYAMNVSPSGAANTIPWAGRTL